MVDFENTIGIHTGRIRFSCGRGSDGTVVLVADSDTAGAVGSVGASEFAFS